MRVSALNPPERQIGRAAPRRARLRLIARRRPARPRHAPIVGRPRLPCERRRGEKAPQRPAGVIVDVGGEAQLAAGPQHARQRRHRSLRDEAPLVLAPLRPGVGIEQINPRKRRVRRLPRSAPSRRPMRTRTLSRPCASIAASSLATPLTKGSQPMKPTSGCSAARASRCSPPPKPISSQSSRAPARTADPPAAPRGRPPGAAAVRASGPPDAPAASCP